MEVRRTVPAPVTSSAVLEVFTARFSVPADSTIAPAAERLMGLLAENVAGPRPKVPALTVVVPEYVFAPPRTNLPPPAFVRPALPATPTVNVVVARSEEHTSELQSLRHL